MGATTSKVFACLGDSIALNAPSRAYSPWSATLDRLLAPFRGAANRGKNSTTTSEWLTRYGASIDTFGFHGVVIGPCAFNDTNTSVDPATSLSNIQAIKTDALGRGMKVIIITGLPSALAPGWNGTKQTALETLRSSILGITPASGLAIVDAYPYFGTSSDPTSMDARWQGTDLDGYHIGQGGGDLLASLVYSAANTLLNPTVITPSTSAIAGVDVAGSAASSEGNAFDNTGRECIVVDNGGASDISVVCPVQLRIDNLEVSPRAVVVPAGGRKVIGPFQPGIYNDANGRARVFFTGVTSVTVKAVKLPLSQ